jgi:NADH:ubiquinone oxidoreductase subunit 5 (subunit L)/multisubunit Na+/H+ antiporter MnhA subunit
MSHELLMLIAILCPTLGSVLLPVAGKVSPRLRNTLSLLMVLTALGCSVALLPSVLSGDLPAAHWEVKNLPLGLALSLKADSLAVFMAIVSSLISAVIVAYSTSYISHYGHQNEYYAMVTMFLGAMMGLVYSSSLILLYLFWEITAITSWRLIGFFREPFQVRRADKAFLVTVFGALCMLLGFIAVWTAAGSCDMDVIHAKLGIGGLPFYAVGLILMGILAKSSTLPFHTWLPDAGVAPSPVTAMLHAAVLVKIGVYVFARLFLVMLPLSLQWQTIVLVLAAASALVSATAALIETDLKRIIAYSTVSQIAFIFLGFASGSTYGAVGGLLYILMHGLAKGGLFLGAGVVEQRTHTKDIRQMGGLIKTMPITAVSFAFCAFSVMGIPPFGGFFSKFMVLSGGINGGHTWLTLVFIAGAVLTILYLTRLFVVVFLGDKTAQANEGSPVMVACVAVLAGLSLLGGLWINGASRWAWSAASGFPVPGLSQ